MQGPTPRPRYRRVPLGGHHEARSPAPLLGLFTPVRLRACAPTPIYYVADRRSPARTSMSSSGSGGKTRRGCRWTSRGERLTHGVARVLRDSRRQSRRLVLVPPASCTGGCKTVRALLHGVELHGSRLRRRVLRAHALYHLVGRGLRPRARSRNAAPAAFLRAVRAVLRHEASLDGMENRSRLQASARGRP
jgi:hypothetical protein